MNTQEDILRKEEQRMQAHYKITPRKTEAPMGDFSITLEALPAAPGRHTQ